MKATTAVIQDTRRPKKDGTFPIKLRITYLREQKYYPTIFSLSIEDFKKVQGAKPRNEHKELSLKLHEVEKKATNVITALPEFTWQAFEKQYLGNRLSKNVISDAFADYSKELRMSDRIGTAVSYECAQRSLEKFYPAARFTDITADILHKYEKWMLNNGNSITTVGIYLRSLRTLFNSAIADGLLNKEYYPFGKRRYEIPTGNNIKKSLSIEAIGAIFNYQLPVGSNAERAKDYWIFMYLCNGMNVKDMCLLKYENIKGDAIEYERAKTSKTKRKVEPIRIELIEDVKNIINKWGNNRVDGSTYIFPTLSKGLSAERERQLIQQLTGVINDHMKIISQALGIQLKCTTYTARHSFATVLKRSGASTEFIGEMLGHTSVKTTHSYLARFENDVRKETVRALTAFKNISE